MKLSGTKTLRTLTVGIACGLLLLKMKGTNEMTTSEQIVVGKTSVVCKTNPEWGKWGICRDCGLWFNIVAQGRSGVLSKTEADEFWEICQ